MLKNKTQKTHLLNINTTTWFTIVVVLFFSVACTKEQTEKIGAIKDRASLPLLHATEITTIISDSGITRYRITTPQWDDYDKAEQPYWEFPSGIHLERFDPNLKVDANLHCQYARFNKQDQLWELKGKVKATNVQGEIFETPLLYWSQRDRKFYTDSVIKITQTSRIITGLGFESNESMTQYSIRKPQGVFPVSENAATASPTMPASPPVQTPVPAAKPNQVAPPVSTSSSSKVTATPYKVIHKKGEP